MKTVYHKADSRGHANHGWLNTHHTFSFANYMDSNRMNFGVLRVLNDDVIAGGRGFGAHPHRDMEIISIPLEGDLQHEDNMGHKGVIQKGKVQVMSAGTGVYHSEKNAHENNPIKLLQIWVIPNQFQVTPRYDEISISEKAKKNDFQQILSPNKNDDGVWIYQDAWFHLADFEKSVSKEYQIKKEGNGVYVFIIKGKAQIGNQILEEKDGYGISDTAAFNLEALDDSEILLMEVPMTLPE